MLQVNDYLEKNITSIKDIILEFDINEEFSSHDFIQKFIGKFEQDYIEMLVSYQKSGQAFQTVHSLIAKHISLKMRVLGIEKTQRKLSENVNGNVANIQWWNRIT